MAPNTVAATIQLVPLLMAPTREVSLSPRPPLPLGMHIMPVTVLGASADGATVECVYIVGTYRGDGGEVLAAEEAGLKVPAYCLVDWFGRSRWVGVGVCVCRS